MNGKNVQQAVDELLADVEDAASRRQRPWSTVATLSRAAEHVVYDPAGAPTGSGNLLGIRTEVAGMLAETWIRSAMSIATAITMFDIGDRRFPTQLPLMTTAPQAGPQAGEKTELPSNAFQIGYERLQIDASGYLNVSMQLRRSPEAEIIAPILRAAAAFDASGQIGAHIVASGTAVVDAAAAWAHFDDSRFQPQVLVCPPSLAPTYVALDYDKAGVTIAVSASVGQAVLMDRGAVIAYVSTMQVTADEPSVIGHQIAVATDGVMSVEPTGVAVIA